MNRLIIVLIACLYSISGFSQTKVDYATIYFYKDASRYGDYPLIMQIENQPQFILATPDNQFVEYKIYSNGNIIFHASTTVGTKTSKEYNIEIGNTYYIYGRFKKGDDNYINLVDYYYADSYFVGIKDTFRLQEDKSNSIHDYIIANRPSDMDSTLNNDSVIIKGVQKPINENCALIKIYRSGSYANSPLNMQIGNQSPFAIKGKELITYKLYSTGKILCSLGKPYGQPELKYLDIEIGKMYYLYLNVDGYSPDWLRVLGQTEFEEKLKKINNSLSFEEDIDNPINSSAKKNSEEVAPSSGTGFLISQNGIIVTNAHVIENYKKITVKGIGGDFTTIYSVKVLVEDKTNDIALLQLENKTLRFDSIPFNVRSSGIETGEEIFTLGYPQITSMGEEIKLTTGVVSSKSGYQGTFSSYQVSALVQPGNSGSPLFDRNGNLIGIINAKLKESDGVTYAIKITYLNSILESSETKNELLNPISTTAIPLVDLVKMYSKYIYIIEVTR